MVQKRDYGNYNFEWFQDEYLENGFTEWDFRLMNEWMWNDSDNFTLDKLKLMEKIGGSIKMNRFRLESELVKTTGDMIKEAFQTSFLPYAMIIVLLLAIVLCVIRKKWISLIGVFALIAGGAFELYYLACLRRVVWRVEFGVWMAVLIFVFVLLTHSEGKSIDQKAKKPIPMAVVSGLTLAFAIVLTTVWSNANLDFSHTSFSQRDMRGYERIKKINETDGLFVMSINEMYGGLCNASSIWDINKRDYEGFFENIISVGGWTIPSPIGMYYANTNGITNVFRAFVDRDDIYYVGGGETMGYLLMYLNEKYGPDIQVRDVEFEWGTAWEFFR